MSLKNCVNNVGGFSALIGLTGLLGAVLGVSFAGGIILFNKADDYLFPNRAQMAVYEMDMRSREWVEQDRKDTSYIHICGKVPCRNSASF